jgi:hypothetical protein
MVFEIAYTDLAISTFHVQRSHSGVFTRVYHFMFTQSFQCGGPSLQPSSSQNQLSTKIITLVSSPTFQLFLLEGIALFIIFKFRYKC